MRHDFLIGLIVCAILAVPVGCFLLSFVLSAFGGMAARGSRDD